MLMECVCVTGNKLEHENNLFLMNEACVKTKEELSDLIISN